MTKTYTIINKKGTTVYWNATEEKVAELGKKIEKYGWTVKENKVYTNNGEYRAPEKWNEGAVREGWVLA